MLEQIIAWVPERWREIVGVLLGPIAWIPPLQRAMVEFFLESPTPWITVAKYIFVLIPMALSIAAIWCTQCALYTLPFRARRQAFVSTMLLMWWDAARAVWFYWVGLVRLAAVLIGWTAMFLGLGVKLTVKNLLRLLLAPFEVSGRMTRQYSQPGVPWIAFVMLLLWCLLEATVLTYVLFRPVARVLAELIGPGDTPLVIAPILFVFLSILVMGSFVCLQALAAALKKREFGLLAQLVVVQVCVMVFEVMFLYRELAQALTPWLVAQTGERLRGGIAFIVTIATVGWIGIRSMTWLLFGQFGTPSLLALISRRPMGEAERPVLKPAASPQVRGLHGEIEEFRREIDWLHEKGDALVEYLCLPVLTVLAVAVNFGMVLVTARPIFSVPFKGLKGVMDTGEALAAMLQQPRKGVSA